MMTIRDSKYNKIMKVNQYAWDDFTERLEDEKLTLAEYVRAMQDMLTRCADAIEIAITENVKWED